MTMVIISKCIELWLYKLFIVIIFSIINLNELGLLIIITIDMIVLSTLDYSVSQETYYMCSTVFIPIGSPLTARLHKVKRF